MSDNSPAATLLRSKSAPAKIHSSQSDSDDENLQVKQKKDGFLSRVWLEIDLSVFYSVAIRLLTANLKRCRHFQTILAPILFLSFIFSLAIVDRKRRLEDERIRGELTKRRRLLYLSLFWTLPRTSIKNPKSRTSSPCHSNSSSRRGSGSSEPGGETTAHDLTSKPPEIRTLAERKQEARTLTDGKQELLFGFLTI